MRISAIFVLTIILAGCIQKQNRDKPFKITWKIQENRFDPDRSVSKLVLYNNSTRTLARNGWSLYFNYIRTVNPETITHSLKVTHVNGDLYRIEPAENFKGLSPGDSLSFTFEGNGISIKKSDAPSGFYVVFSDGSIRNIGSADVLSIDTGALYEEYPHLERPNSAYYYRQSENLDTLPVALVTRITPTPLKVSKRTGLFSLDSELLLYFQKDLKNEAEQASRFIQSHTGIKPKVSSDVEAQKRADIVLKKGVIRYDGLRLGPEAYQLSANEDILTITGSTRAGVFYGLQSMYAWMINSQKAENLKITKLPNVQITDAPRFDYRGFHLDVARNFQPAEKVKELLDVMGRYKLNKFHFHLTDDEGWRLAIEGLPELTQIGGRRGHTLTEEKHLVPSYGSGPFVGTASGSGWYSREEFKEILTYAASRHIEVIPEIDLPGHARAAIIAMKARAENNTMNRYRLDDPRDQSEYRSVQGWNDNVINVCRESSYRFIEKVVDEIVQMYKEAGAPLRSIHIGGDEVPSGVWQKSPVCKTFIAENKEVEEVSDLPIYFFSRVQKLFAERNLMMSGWQEVAQTHEEEGVAVNRSLASKVRPYVWLNIWGSGTEDYAYKLANAGFDVIMSQANMLYFDMAYDHHPDEPGFYWAAFINNRDPFYFMPFDLFKNGEVDKFGRPIPASYFNDMVRLTKEGETNIMGMQGQLWGETLVTPNRVDLMAFPRLLSLAERAWSSQPDWALMEEESKRRKSMEDAWSEFANRLGAFELYRLHGKGDSLDYHLTPPGIINEGGIIKINTAFPHSQIRYTIDGSIPDMESKLYEKPFPYQQGSVVKAKTFTDKKHASRMSVLKK